MNEVIKAYIDTYVKENGNEEITGAILNSTLNEMVSQLYAHRCYGVITPSLPMLYADDIPAWGVASQNGTYTNYGDIEVSDELALIVYDGSTFTKQTIISKSWINNLVNDLNNKLIGTATIKYNPTLDVVEIEYANGTTLQIGREQVSFVYNDTESTIVNGTPVYYSGVGGSGVQMPAIAEADASNLATAMVKGHTTIDIPANSYGIIVCKGEMTVESHGLTVGSKIYLGVGGGYVNTPPSNPNLTIELGIVLDADTLHVYPCIISTISHTDLSNLNSDDNFLHVTSGQVTAWNNKLDGPASSINNSVPVYDGVTGKLLKDKQVAFIDILNNLGVGTQYPTQKLDIVGNMNLGYNVTDETTRSHAVAKSGALSLIHYLLSEENVSVFYSHSGSTANSIEIGGGVSSQNAATLLQFYTAANTTTLTGTERMRIDSAGNVGIGTNNPSEKLQVIGNTLASGDSASATKTIGGKVRMEYDTATDTLEFNFI